jgi:ABC-type glycerol-3-phosphate transport system substrate-binding protein
MMEAMTVKSCTARAGWVAGSALMLGALGCGTADEPCDEPGGCGHDGALELATWWGTRGELYASFDILRQSYRRQTRSEVELAHRLQNKSDHTTWVEEELEASPPPKPLDVFSANNGDEVLHWTRCAASGSPPEQPKLRGLTDPALGWLSLAPDWIADTFEPKVMETLQCEDETYALPVGIHRINTLFFNKALFRAAGYAVAGEADGAKPLPNTLAELHDAAAAVTERFPPADPADRLPRSAFAVAGRDAWTLSLFVIENVMLSIAADGERYQRYWRGQDCDQPLLEQTLEEVRSLRQYFGNPDLNASEALARVASGQAAMMVMGDWAMAELDADLVGVMPFPGTSQEFVFSADVFALPAIETADVRKGLAWLRSMTMEQTQRDFSVAKSARPARVDIAAELFPSPEVPLEWVRSLPGLLPYQPDGPFSQLQNELQQWLYADDDGTQLIEYASAQYSKLSHGTVRCEPIVDAPGDLGPTLVKDGARRVPEIE